MTLEYLYGSPQKISKKEPNVQSSIHTVTKPAKQRNEIPITNTTEIVKQESEEPITDTMVEKVSNNICDQVCLNVILLAYDLHFPAYRLYKIPKEMLWDSLFKQNQP